MRFVEVAGKESEIEVQTPLFEVKSAWLTMHWRGSKGTFQVLPYGFRFSVKPFQIVTVRLEAAANLK